MNSDDQSKTVVGNFVSLLTLMFIGFKIAHIIDWSWVWVLSPMWISAALAVVIVLVAYLLDR